jgi:hypothetical protein
MGVAIVVGGIFNRKQELKQVGSVLQTMSSWIFLLSQKVANDGGLDQKL